MCDCGNVIQVETHDLRAGHITKCRKCGSTQHGMAYTRLYNVWREIKRRCLTPTNDKWHLYGGRGIKICDEWANDFTSFYNWSMENGYDENAERGEFTIDRIDVNGNYEPSNCWWVDMKTQQNNKRTNIFLEYNGERHTMTEWAKIVDIPYYIITKRRKNGWSDFDILSTPHTTQRRRA